MNHRARVFLSWLLILGGVVRQVSAATPTNAPANEGRNVLTKEEKAAGWVLLFDGQTLKGWTPRGTAKWEVVDGTLSSIPNTGSGMLCTEELYQNFEIKAEFWENEKANSGIYFRCVLTGPVTGTNSYEANIYDKQPGGAFPTGSLVNVTRPPDQPSTIDRWNTYEIKADGDHFLLKLNGVQVVDSHDTKHLAAGPIGLQQSAGAGVVRFRSIKVRRWP